MEVKEEGRVINTKIDMEKVMKVLIGLIEEQEEVTIEYTLERKSEEETV